MTVSSSDYDSLLEKTYFESLEDIGQFAWDFMTYFDTTIGNRQTAYLEKYIGYDEYVDLAVYTEEMHRFMIREKFANNTEWMHHSELELRSNVKVAELGDHYYLVTVPYTSYQGDGQAQFLVNFNSLDPRIENLYLGMAGSIDEIVAGSLDERDMENPEKWLDSAWTEAVLTDLDNYGEELLAQAQENWPSYQVGDFGDYYASGDATWSTEGNSYAYRLVLSGQMPNAALGTTFVVLSNDLSIDFDDAMWACGISSNLEDYFSPDRAKIVDWQSYELPVTELPAFTYGGDDEILKIICNYMVSMDYDVNNALGVVEIPAPVIVYVDDSDSEYTKVWANLWSFNYTLDGTTLVSESGGENPCLLYIRKGDYPVVANVYEVGDGSNHLKDVRKITREHPEVYQELLDVMGDSRNEKCVEVREKLLRYYVNYYELDVDSYQDYGWEPVMLE